MQLVIPFHDFMVKILEASNGFKLISFFIFFQNFLPRSRSQHLSEKQLQVRELQMKHLGEVFEASFDVELQCIWGGPGPGSQGY